MRLAKEIRVDRDEHGAPRITIDGQQLPWYTQGIVPRAPSLDDWGAITITIPAETITMIDDRATDIPDQPREQPHATVDPGALIRFRNWLESGCDDPYFIDQFRADLQQLLAALDPAERPAATACPHCPDGHTDPNRRPWSVWVTQTRSDGQPTHLEIAPSNCAHVAESDAEWLREVIAKARRAASA